MQKETLNYRNSNKHVNLRRSEKVQNVDSLNLILANEFAIFTKTLNYHWNVSGERFFSLHKYLEEQYHLLLNVMDSLAERVRVRGNHPVSTVKEIEASMSIEETTKTPFSSGDMLQDLLTCHEKLKEQIKDALSSGDFSSDPGTEDLLTDILRKHEMAGWMIRSYLN